MADREAGRLLERKRDFFPFIKWRCTGHLSLPFWQTICKFLQGTGSPDGLGFSWHIWIDLGLKKGRGWFLNFLGAPSIIH
jgi:hypothetical protein